MQQTQRNLYWMGLKETSFSRKEPLDHIIWQLQLRKHEPVKQGWGKPNMAKAGKAESMRSLSFLLPRETVKVLGALQLKEGKDTFL